MPRNVEIKAKVDNLEHVKNKAAEMSQSEGQIIDQMDTFFHVPHGRMKLRYLVNAPSQLIFYNREDKSGPKLSDYVVYPVENSPENLEKTLQLAIGILGKVKKRRILYLVGQTRVHCDDVEGLGTFLELEVLLDDTQSVDDGVKIANELMDKLGVDKSNLITGSYLDLLLNLNR